MAITAIFFFISGMAVVATASLPDSNTNNLSIAKEGEAALYTFPKVLDSPNALRNHQL